MSNAALEPLARIESARKYTVDLLSHVELSDWFRMPQEGVTHVAWQVGHLAFAQYRLGLERIRGVRPDDEKLIPRAFLERFGRDSRPSGEPAAYPPIDDIRRVFDAVHQQVRKEIAALPAEVLDQAPDSPHRRFTDKRGSLLWCAEHEMLHAGQIGLLRRLLGMQPIW